MFGKMMAFKGLVKDPFDKLTSNIKEGIQSGISMLDQEKMVFTQIVPKKMFYIDYPTKKSILSLQQKLKQANEYQIWNIGQYPYEEDILSALLLGKGGRNSDGKQRIFNLTFQYFANIPFCQMIKAIESIEAFLGMHQKNQVFIHCQSNKRRSSVFLSGYLFLTGAQSDIAHAISAVNKCLSVSTEEKAVQDLRTSIYKAQHLTLKNLLNYANDNSFINKNSWFLKKIMITNAPKISQVLRIKINPPTTTQNIDNHNKNINTNKTIGSTSSKQNIKFKVMIEIRSDIGVIYKKKFDDEFIEGESLCLRIKEQCQLKDDFLIIVKYIHEKKAHSILRSQLNTNFIYDSYVRVHRMEMDLSVKTSSSKNQQIFMDLELKQNPDVQSELSKISILKESTAQNQSISSRKQKQLKEKQRKISDQDDFKIVDEQALAAQNEKIDQQVEEELKRQLQNLRSRKVAQLVKQDTKKKKQDPKARSSRSKQQKKSSKIQETADKSLRSSQPSTATSTTQNKETKKEQKSNAQPTNNEKKQQTLAHYEKDLNVSKKIVNQLKNEPQIQKNTQQANQSNKNNTKQQQNAKTKNQDQQTKQPKSIADECGEQQQKVKEKQSKSDQQKQQTINDEGQQKNRDQSQQQSDSQNSSSSSSQQSDDQGEEQEEQEEEEEEEDLDSYLENLEKQAEKKV